MYSVKVKICIFLLVLSFVCAAGAADPNYIGAGHWDTATMKAYYSSQVSPDHGAINTVNGSGLAGVHPNQTHSVAHVDMWHSAYNDGSVIRTAPGGTSCCEYVAYDFGKPYRLGTSWVWNHNQAGATDSSLASVTIDYSVDGFHWNTLGTFSWPQADGTTEYAGFTGPDFGEVWAKYVVIAAHSTYGRPYFGLSEIRFDVPDPEADPSTIPTYPPQESWDFAGDLSFFSNPNGVWSYGWVVQFDDPNAPQNDPEDPLYDPDFTFRDSPNTTDMMLYDNYFVFSGTGVSIPFWHFAPASPYLVPAVIGNPTNQTVLGVPPGRTALHGGVNFANPGTEDMSVVRWTAPAAGDYCVSGTFDSGDTGLSDYYIIQNKTTLLLSELNVNFGKPFEMTVTVEEGETLDFVVGSGLDNVGSDTVPLSVTIVPGPCAEPPVCPDSLWDLKDNISFEENPHCGWSYGWIPGSDAEDPNYAWRDNPPDTSTFSLYGQAYTFSGVPWWHLVPANGSMVPALFHNNLTTTLYGCPPGFVAAHPGVTVIDEDPNTADVAVVRWTAPATDDYFVKAIFYQGDGGEVDCYVIQNTTTVLFSQLEVVSEVSYRSFLTLNAGDTLDFAVGSGVNLGSETTPLEVTIYTEPTCQDVGVFYPADLNQDCRVNLEDFALLSQDWLKCNDPEDPGCSLIEPQNDVLRVDFNGYNSEDVPSVNNTLMTASIPGQFGTGTFWNGLMVSYATSNTISSIYPGPTLFLADGTTDSGVTVTLTGCDLADLLGYGDVFGDYLLKLDTATEDPNIYIAISGLVPGNAYNLAGYGSNGGGGLGAIWTANGVGPLNLGAGVANVGILPNVIADANGTITIALGADPAANIIVVNGFELEGIINSDPTCTEINRYYGTDLDQNCYVDLGDFTILTEEWLNCNDPQGEGCTLYNP